jgi:hypothetical protein
VQADGGGAEPAAVVAQQAAVLAEPVGERGGLPGQLAHAIAVAGAGGGVGGGLDQQAAFGGQPGIGAAQPGGSRRR